MKFAIKMIAMVLGIWTVMPWVFKYLTQYMVWVATFGK